MEPEQRRAAKQQMLALMEAGVSWQEAATTAGVQTSRATAYRWRQEARTRGEAALQDGRHGHPAKVLPPVLHWLELRCQATSLVASSQLQKELQEQLGVRISRVSGILCFCLSKLRQEAVICAQKQGVNLFGQLTQLDWDRFRW